MERRDLKPPIAAAAKWEATVTARLENASATLIWPLLQDFFGIHKYFPSLRISYGVEGNNGEIGSIRHCEGSKIPARESRGNGGGDGGNCNPPPPVSWSREKLIAIDQNQRSLSYEMMENNIGFSSYVSTIRILVDPESGDIGSGGRVLQWRFSVDPVEGLNFEELATKYEVGLQLMAQRMEDAVLRMAKEIH